MIAFRGGCSRAEVGEKAFGRVAFAIVLRGTIVTVKGFGGERKYLFQRRMHPSAFAFFASLNIGLQIR